MGKFFVLFILVTLFHPWIIQKSLNSTPKTVQQGKLSKFNIINKMNNVEDDLENVLSITRHDPATVQEGLTIFGVWRVTSPTVENFLDSMIIITDMEGNVKSSLQFPHMKGLSGIQNSSIPPLLSIF